MLSILTMQRQAVVGFFLIPLLSSAPGILLRPSGAYRYDYGEFPYYSYATVYIRIAYAGQILPYSSQQASYY